MRHSILPEAVATTAYARIATNGITTKTPIDSDAPLA